MADLKLTPASVSFFIVFLIGIFLKISWSLVNAYGRSIQPKGATEPQYFLGNPELFNQLTVLTSACGVFGITALFGDTGIALSQLGITCTVAFLSFFHKYSPIQQNGSQSNAGKVQAKERATIISDMASFQKWSYDNQKVSLELQQKVRENVKRRQEQAEANNTAEREQAAQKHNQEALDNEKQAIRNTEERKAKRRSQLVKDRKIIELAQARARKRDERKSSLTVISVSNSKFSRDLDR